MPEYFGQLQSITFTHTLWLIPALALLGAVINAILGSRLQRCSCGQTLAARFHIGSLPVSAVGMGSAGLGFLLSIGQVVRLARLPQDHRVLFEHLWQMFRVGSFDASFDLSLDALSAVMLLVVTGVGFLIHAYAGGYMNKEASYWRFFSYLNLLMFSMLLLVLGDNFIVMFFGWQGTGLCSYLLLGFSYRDYKTVSAGTKAFIAGRIGDFGFIGGLLVLIWGLGGGWTANDEYVLDRVPRLVPAAIQTQAEAVAEHQPDRGDKAENKTIKAIRDIHEMPLRGTALLTFVAFPGAVVYLDNNMSAPFATAPFVRKEVSAQPHTFRIAMGGGTEDLIVDRVVLAPGKETLLTALGPAVSFRQLHDQFALNMIDPTQLHPEVSAPIYDRIIGKFDSQHSLWIQMPRTLWGIGILTLACLGFLLAAVGKSAQIPLHVWLAETASGSVPAVALIHSATTAVAGVYLMARLSFLFSLSPAASGVVAAIGALTAISAAVIGIFQYDLKKLLAYSTISQAGFMFIGIGVGAYWVAMFHLVTHAFFRACLLLGSGSIVQGMQAAEPDEARAQDLRNMGGLGKLMPRTRRTYQIACFAITAVPIPLFAGFWSQNAILWKAFNTLNTGWVPGWLIWAVGLAAALATAFCLWRSYYLAFEGQPSTNDIPEKVHESSPVMTYVLVALAALSAAGGIVLGFSTHLIGGEGETLLQHWLQPVFQNARIAFKDTGLSLELGLVVVSTVLAIIPWSVARKRYGPQRPGEWEKREQSSFAFKLLADKNYFDRFCNAPAVRGALGLSLILRDMDRFVLDGPAELAADVTIGVSRRIGCSGPAKLRNYVVVLLGAVALLVVIVMVLLHCSTAQ